MNAMLVKYLKDFSAPEPVTQQVDDILSSLANSDFDEPFSLPDLEPAVDIEAERQAARQEALEEAAAQHEAQLAEAMASLEEAHRQELAALADRHENEVMAIIHARFHDMTMAVSQSVADQTLHLLLPLIEADVARRSVEALADAIKAAFAEDNLVEIVVRGPSALFEKLSQRFAIDGIACRHIEAATTDILVDVNDSVLSTRLGVWAQSLAEVMP